MIISCCAKACRSWFATSPTVTGALICEGFTATNSLKEAEAGIEKDSSVPFRDVSICSGFIPSANHAGGLRYHGMSPTLSQLYHDGYMEARAVEQTSIFEAAELFARTEGTLPAPESSHAIKVAIDEAVKCKETGEEKTILFGLTGTGYFDMYAYEKFHNGEMSDYIPTDEELEASFATMPKVD